MGFDPDKYLAKKAGEAPGGFDPDLYLAKKAQPGGLESALRGLAQGASLGFADEITGGLESLFTKKSYEQARDESRANYKAAKEANPGFYTTGELGGAVGTALIPGIGAAGSLGKVALSGAALGALGGVGASEEKDALGIAKDAAIGAGTGAALGAAAHGAGKLLEKGIPKAGLALQVAAEDRGASALGMSKALRNKLGDERVREVSRNALDNKVITPLSSTKKMLERAAELGDESGAAIGHTMEELDKQGVKAFNPLEVGVRVDSEIGNVYRNEPLFKGLSNQYENTLETILNRGDKPTTFAEAQKLKEVLGQYGYKEGMAVPGKELAQRVGGVVKDELEKSVEAGAKQLSNAEMAQKYLQAKKNYGASQDMTKALENRLAGEQGNQGGIIGGLFGLRDAGAKAVGAATGGPAGYVAGEVAASGARAFGNQMSAVALDKASKFLLQSPKFQQLAQTNPKAFKAAVIDLSRRFQSPKTMPAAAGSELDRDSSTPAQYKPENQGQPEPEEARRRFIEGN